MIMQYFMHVHLISVFNNYNTNYKVSNLHCPEMMHKKSVLNDSLPGRPLAPPSCALYTVSQAQHVVYAVRSREEGETTAAVSEALSRHTAALGAGEKGGKEEDSGKTEREFITASHICSDASAEEYHVTVLQPKVIHTIIIVFYIVQVV